MTEDMNTYTEKEVIETLKKNIFGRGWEGKLAPPQWKQKTDDLDQDLKNLLEIVTQIVKDDIETQTGIAILEDKANKLEKWQNRAEDKSAELNLGQRVCNLENDMEAIGKCVNDLVRGAVPEAVNYGVNKPWMNDRNRETAARSAYGYLENDSVCGHIRSDIVGKKVDEVISRYGTGANSKMVAEIVRLHFQTREGTQNDR